MYAIQNIKTGKFVYGTNFSYDRDKITQNTDADMMLTFNDLRQAKHEFDRRNCSIEDYRVVKLKRPEVERVIELDDEDGYDY